MSRLDPNLSSEEVSNNGRGKEWPPIWKFGFSSFKVCGGGMAPKNSLVCAEKFYANHAQLNGQDSGIEESSVCFCFTNILLALAASNEYYHGEWRLSSH